jgi:UDP-glucose:(heptosyl)LPS alpha-1,3-glucosyltransferase
VKIAFVVHDYRRLEGHSRYVVELATRFARDHDVHVFANRIEAEGDARIQFHRVPAYRRTALTGILSFAVEATLHVRGQFDIIHNQGLCGVRGNVFTAHMCNDAWHAALLKHEEGATLRESVFNVITGGLERAMYRFARNSEVIAVSERVGRDLVEYYRCPAPMHVIYHGTDLETFSPENRQRYRNEARAQYGIPQDEFVFLYVGNLRKGARRSMQALAEVEKGVLLCVGASAPDSYRQFAKELGLENRVIFGGRTNQVVRAFAAGDAFLLPTPYDPFALVVSEAMGCGLPVIVSREAGVAELIRHGANGLLLEDVTSHSELARHMRSLQDREWAEELGRAGRKTVESLTWDAVAEQTMAVYMDLIRKRKAVAG